MCIVIVSLWQKSIGIRTTLYRCKDQYLDTTKDTNLLLYSYKICKVKCNIRSKQLIIELICLKTFQEWYLFLTHKNCLWIQKAKQQSTDNCQSSRHHHPKLRWLYMSPYYSKYWPKFFSSYAFQLGYNKKFNNIVRWILWYSYSTSVLSDSIIIICTCCSHINVQKSSTVFSSGFWVNMNWLAFL